MADIEKKVKQGLQCCLDAISVIEQMGTIIKSQESDLTETLEVLAKCEKEIERPKQGGTYECFHCGSRSVIWGADFSFEDYGREGEGIVHTLHCDNCGAEIEYYIPIGEAEE